MGRHIVPACCHSCRPVEGQVSSLSRGRSVPRPWSSIEAIRREIDAAACNWRSLRKLFSVSLLIQAGSLLLKPCLAQKPAQWFCLSCLWTVLTRWTSTARVSTMLAASLDPLSDPIRLPPMIPALSVLISCASLRTSPTAAKQGTLSSRISIPLGANSCCVHCLSTSFPCASSLALRT